MVLKRSLTRSGDSIVKVFLLVSFGLTESRTYRINLSNDFDSPLRIFHCQQHFEKLPLQYERLLRTRRKLVRVSQQNLLVFTGLLLFSPFPWPTRSA